MKRVAIIGTAGVPGKYGGFETLAHHFVKNLAQDYQLSVYCSNVYYSKEERVEEWNNARLHYLPFNANGAQSVVYDVLSMLHAIFRNDVLLVLGVSGGIFLPFVRMFTSKKIIVNIDGLEWRRQKWSKGVRRFLKFSERLAVKFSHEVVTDNMALKTYVAEEYQNVSHLIEYGSDHVQVQAAAEVNFEGFEHAQSYLGAYKGQYAMKVCRIEPENNIHLVLEAFAKTKQVQLLMIGNWDNSDYGRSMRAKYGNCDNISLFDPIYNQGILDQLRSNCLFYVHGHSAGGTNPSLVEAMWLALPIIAYGVVYNKETTENAAIYFDSTDDLCQHLENLDAEDYKKVGEKMRSIAKRRYTWSIISQKYAAVISEVLKNKG